MDIAYGELTLSIRSKSGDNPSLPMRDFGRVIDAIVSIHDNMYRIAHPDAESVPSPVITGISKQSPAWLKLLSFKDIVDAIASLLKLPGELEHQRTENSKLMKEIERLDEQILSDRELGSYSESMHAQEHRMMEERLLQERMRTVGLYHETVMKVYESYLSVCQRQPVAADVLRPITFETTRALGEIVNSDVIVIVEHTESVGQEMAFDLGFRQISTLLPQRGVQGIIDEREND